MRLFDRSPEGRYALSALRQLSLPVAVYRVRGRTAPFRLERVFANAAAEALPPPDAAWTPACADAVATQQARALGTVPPGPSGAWAVRALPLDDDAVALVYEREAHTDAPDAVAPGAPPAPDATASAQAILDAIGDVVLVYPLSPDGPQPITAFNQAAIDTYGYAPDTLRGMTVSQIVDPSRFNIAQGIEELMRRREGRFDSVHVTHDGRRIPMQTSARLFEHDGKLCVLAVCRDDSERRAFQRQLARTNADLERAVAERTAQLEAFSAHLKILHRITTTDHATAHDRAMAYLTAGCEMFGLEVGILSRVYPDPATGASLYRVEAIVVPDGSIPEGTTVPLADTFCDDVVAQEKTVSFTDASADPRIACLAAHADRGLHAFIGTPMWIEGRLAGTLNFSAPAPRATPFAAYEHELIEIMADAMARRLREDKLATAA